MINRRSRPSTEFLRLNSVRYCLAYREQISVYSIQTTKEENKISKMEIKSTY